VTAIGHLRSPTSGGYAAARSPALADFLTPARAAVAIAVLLSIVCYLPALHNGFALDDITIVRDNLRIHRLSTIPQALALPYWYEEGHLYRPLTTLAFGLEWAIGGGQPLVFHIVNLLWHATVTALVVRLALRWWPPLAAGLAGVWFAVHPVHAEAVTNIVGRSELVCAAALLGLAILAATPVSDMTPAAQRRQWWWAATLAAAAMASKEIGAVAPVIAWLAAITPTAASPRRDIRAGWRLVVAASAGVGVLLAARLIVLGSFAGDAPHYAFSLVHGASALILALATIPTAVSLLLVPQPPRLDYSPPEATVFHPSPAAVATGIVLVVVAIALVVRHARRPGAWTAAACLAVATFAPVSNLVVHTGIVVADRTLYSASAGVALIVGAVVGIAWQRRQRVIVAGAALVTAMGAVFTVQSLSAWHDSRAAFDAIRDRSPTSFIGHYMVAKARDVDGDPAGAQVEYARAVALTPHNAALLYMAGANALRLRDTDQAMTLIGRAVALDPTRARARTALAGLTLARGDTAGAVALLHEGIALDSTQRTWKAMLGGLAAPRK
jgi:hypothetical protein